MSLAQYLVIGVNDFGAQVLERCRALPIDRNVVYHHLPCPPERPVAQAYLEYRQRLLDVLNREVFNFANTPLTVYLVGLLSERHMAANLMHLGYLFKTFFRENITLNPRVKVITALPTILPEEAFAWLPETRRALEIIDGHASLKSPFVPAYDDVKRVLPALSGPPCEELTFCYSESLDAEDIDVSTQAAATLIYFDLVLRPARAQENPDVVQFQRSLPVGQGFAPITGCAVAFLPSLTRLVRDELEYALLVNLVDRFFSGEAPPASALEPLVEDVLRRVGAARPRDLLDELTRHALEEERWFDLTALDPAARYDIEMSPPPHAHLTSLLGTLERERNRNASRVRDLALERLLALPGRLLEALRDGHPNLDLRATEALLTASYARVSTLLEAVPKLIRDLRGEREGLLLAAHEKAARLKELAEAKEARFKRGSETEGRAKEILRQVDTRALLRLDLALVAAEAWVSEQTPPLETRLSATYDTRRKGLTAFLARRQELLAHLAARRDVYLKRRELHLYVFNQVFRERLLDAEIAKVMADVPQLATTEPLAPLVGRFFFKTWLARPDLPLEEAETALLEAVRLKAGRETEGLAARIQVDFAAVVRLLGEIVEGQAGAIFDAKYEEHPRAVTRRTLTLCHRDERLEAALGALPRERFDLVDVARVPALPFEVLELVEIHNLPFRALRQYASLDRQEA